ncbi:MAG: Ig-like domain-containing protein, partial [Anaeroplasmataceae bacterium]
KDSIVKATKDGKDIEIGTLVGSSNDKNLSYKFIEEGVYTLEVAASDISGNNETKKIVNFVIDKTAAVVSAEMKDTNSTSYYKSGKEINISVEEKWYEYNNVEIQFNEELDNKISETVINETPKWINSGEKSTVTYKINKDGKYNLKVIATDKAGNVKESKELNFTIDKTNPEIIIDEKSNITSNSYYKENKDMAVVIEDTNLDSKTIEVKKDGKAYSIGDLIEIEKDKKYKLDYIFQEDGKYEILVKAKDKSGNENSKTLNFVVDKTKPVIDIQNIDDNELYNIDKETIIKITDINHKVNNITITKPNGEVVNYDDVIAENNVVTVKYNLNDEGIYNISVESIDMAGNKESDSKSVTIDKTIPVITISKEADYNKKIDKIILNINELNFDENKLNIGLLKTLPGKPQESIQLKADKIEVSKDDKNVKIITISDKFTDDAEYILIVNFIDNAGNGAKTQDYKFVVDSIKPTINLNGFEDKKHYNSNEINVSVSNEDVNHKDNNIIITKDNIEVINTNKFELESNSAKISLNLKDEGSYNVVVSSKDSAGNENQETRSFILDRTAPVISINNIETLNNSFNNNPKSVEIAVDELNWNYKLLDNSNIVKISYTKTTPDGKVTEFNPSFDMSSKNTSHGYNDFTEDAIYSLNVIAQDLAGNVAIKKQLVFTMDSVKPNITIEGVEKDGYYNTDKKLSISSVDVNHNINNIIVTKDGNIYSVGTFLGNDRERVFSYNFKEEGIYEINIESIDKASNKNTNSTKFTIDKTAPVITPTFQGENRVIKNGEFINKVFTPDFKLDKPSEDKIDRITLNGNGVGVGAVPMSSAETLYTYEVIASDKAQNKTTLNITFTVDTTMPTVAIQGIINGFFSKDIIPTYEIKDTNLDNARTAATLNGATFASGSKVVDQNYYNLKFVGTDLANNITGKNIDFVIDKDNPVIRFSEPISNKYFKEDFTPKFLIDDLTDYTIIAMTLNGEDYEIGDPITTEGKQVLYLEVKD